MTRAADVPLPEPVFHVLRETARPDLELRHHTPPGVDFLYEAVDDNLGARHRIDSSRCGRQAPRRREDRERHQTPRHRGVVSDTSRTRLTRTRVAVCGSVRIPLLPSAKRASRPSHSPLSAAPSSRPMLGRYRTRITRERVVACGGVRIRGRRAPASVGLRAATRTSRPSRNPLPAAPSHQSMPDRLCTRLSRTRDAVCGFVRIQDGPHPSRKDTRP